MQIVTQLSVFLENRPGMLARTCQALAKAKIGILALSIVDTIDHSVVRMVVDQAKAAEQILSNLHTMVQVRDVIVMEVPNQVGAVAHIAEQLAEAGINIEYAYCTALPTQAIGILVLRTNDLEATINALS